MPLAGENELSAISKDPQALIRIPVGAIAISPLWGLFAGAAVSGAAWWWMTRWARPANLEAAFGAAEAEATKAEAEVETLAAPVAEAVEAAPALAEPVLEVAVEAVEAAPAVVGALVEAAVEPAAAETVLPVAETLIEAAPEAVGGESAPISPVLEALSPEVAAPAVTPEPAAEPMVETAAEAPKFAPKPKKAAPPRAD